MKSFVSPIASKTFDEDIASNLDVLQQLFVIRQGTASLTVDFGELDLFQQFGCIQNVLETSKCIVEVSHLGPVNEWVS